MLYYYALVDRIDYVLLIDVPKSLMIGQIRKRTEEIITWIVLL